MTRSIYKYPLQLGDNNVIRAAGFAPLDVQLQNGVITLWAEVSPRSEYIATVQLPDGTVWHAYLMDGAI